MSVREPAVQGLFYPAEAEQLKSMVKGFLRTGSKDQSHRLSEPPKAIIVPHAGLVYSGPVAAQAYARLNLRAADIRRVVLAGPSHRVAFQGLAVPVSSDFQTALGTVHVSETLKRDALAFPQVFEHDQPHLHEHSLEVQLPFLQTCFTDFEILPLVVGDASASQVAEVLEALWGGDETLIVASSDLSHYLDYESACRKDLATSLRIVNREYTLKGDEACGCRVLNGLLKLAVAKGCSVEQLMLANSGDTAGDKSRVVGYGAYALH